jgi:hypothetical protein
LLILPAKVSSIGIPPYGLRGQSTTSLGMGLAIHPKSQELAQPTLLVSLSLGSLGCVETMSPNHKRHSFCLKHISLLSRPAFLLFCIPQSPIFVIFHHFSATVRF